ncbi:MBL fold metallo-hydrolase [Dictyobacter formicarum]|uniref:MBL fold metallo-hydrolase n=1 Tax=Dictyobacter formicarum TaxID=2778368 RepID=A0ABQ3VSR6_9CHLR|nr:MBL fold metallo-hydrolase [Dictyobacter formicarum]GHO88858.1 MBL fold metallo-hydrolase [Dictyobacter formicarum]
MQQEYRLITTEQQAHFLVRFWGVRGSYPTPGLHTIRHGGNTACVEVQVGKHILIFDAGSGIIGLGRDLLHRSSGNLTISLLLTHGHGDHLTGFPFFAPLFEGRSTLYLFGPSLAGRTVEQLITPLMSSPYFPVDMRTLPSTRLFHTLTRGEAITWHHGEDTPCIGRHNEYDRATTEIRVSTHYTANHGPDGLMIYRVEYAGRSLVYCTDVEWKDHYPSACVNFVRGADLLIHDAQYTYEDYQASKHGFGHSTSEMAVGMARKAEVAKLILFHHDPSYNDDKLDWIESQARKQFASTRSAYEGMEIDLLAARIQQPPRVQEEYRPV